jgi:hypothetical protein
MIHLELTLSGLRPMKPHLPHTGRSTISNSLHCCAMKNRLDSMTDQGLANSPKRRSLYVWKIVLAACGYRLMTAESGGYFTSSHVTPMTKNKRAEAHAGMRFHWSDLSLSWLGIVQFQRININIFLKLYYIIHPICTNFIVQHDRPLCHAFRLRHHIRNRPPSK